MITRALYLHIPFCQQICAYCDFCKVFYQEHQADAYLERLKGELQGLKIDDYLETVYIGGGTPSSLSDEQLERLMDIIKPYLSKETKEVTIEVNPESVDYYKLKLLKDGGVNRLSIGVETFNDDLLKRINRHHSAMQVKRVIKYAKKIGFENISIDLMYGLPGQTMADIENDLAIVKTLEIQHLSYYALILEDHTVLKNQNYQPLDEVSEDKINCLIDTTLKNQGFNKYEVSNYAKKGYESLHNLAYWHYDNYYGVGIGATSKIDDLLIEHNRNLKAYLARQKIVETTTNTIADTMFNHVMMSLRLVAGLDLDEFAMRYGKKIDEVYPAALEKHLGQGTLLIKDNHLCCSQESLKLLNTILMDFLD